MTDANAISLLIVEDNADFRDSCVRWMQGKATVWLRLPIAPKRSACWIESTLMSGFLISIFPIYLESNCSNEYVMQTSILKYHLTGQGNIESQWSR